MNGRQTTQGSDEDVSGYCRHDEHGACHGNVDLKGGPGPAVPLHRCTCPCHQGRLRQARYA